MAKRKIQITSQNLLFILIVSVILGLYYYWSNSQEAVVNSDLKYSSEFSVHFVDVGQGDCTLIRVGDKNILVDAGDVEYDSVVLNYLKKENVQKIDLLIATHPDADHIGGMDSVVNKLDIAQIVMPQLKASITPTSNVYKNLLTAISDKGLKIDKAEVGQIYDINGAKVEILGPAGDFDSSNDMSVIAKISYKDYSVLLSGDAEKKSENATLKLEKDLKSTIFKAGHHGSSTSNTQNFIEGINPDYFVISVGGDNSYGHPHKKVLELFEKYNKLIYRTDINGTIIFYLEENQLKVITQK